MKRFLIVPFVILLAVILQIRCTNNVAGNATQTGNAVGILYNPNGSPAVNAKVLALPVDHNPKSIIEERTLIIDSTTTNDNGEYSFDSLPGGFYNILGEGDSGLSYNDSILINEDTSNSIPPDTLKCDGSLRGVIRLQPGDDSRTVIILVFGTKTWTAPIDSIGNFALENMAEGTYNVRFLTTLDDYSPLDTNLTIRAGMEDTLSDTLYMHFTGIPVPTGLKLNYDTLMQIVTLTWNKADTNLVKGYNVYRKHSDSDFVKINTAIISDTTYSDSAASQDKIYEYKITAVNLNDNEGNKSEGVQVEVVPSLELIDSVQMSIGTGNSYVISLGDSVFVDRTKDVITVLDSSFNIVKSFNLPNDFGNGEGHEIDNQGRIWATNYNNGYVNIYLQNGTLVDSIRDSDIRYPNVLKRNPQGYMFIKSEVEPYIEVIRIYSTEGDFVSLFPNDSLPIRTFVTDMFFDMNGNLTILNHTDSLVTIYDSIGNETAQFKMWSHVVQLRQFSNGDYAIIQEGGRGILNILNSEFQLITIFGTGLGIDYRDFGRLTIDTSDRIIIRRISSIIIYRRK